MEIDSVKVETYKTFTPKNKIRYVTATALFDGHDASINIMRRLLQARGAEVIHLGHNRTAKEIVDAAIQEDVQAIALSSYQGGHVELFKYIRQLLDLAGFNHVKLFGGGGGVISPSEIKDLEAHGITKIYSPEDGQRLGLDGIIGHMLYWSDVAFTSFSESLKSTGFLARALTLLESGKDNLESLKQKVKGLGGIDKKPLILGFTGTGGAGKSSLVDEILLRFLEDFKDIKIGLICVDPSKKKTGGALLGDRIRINSCADDRIFLRSLASRGSGREIAESTGAAKELLQAFGFHLIIVETSGIGQGDSGILGLCDKSLYVMTPEYGASSQLEKIDMLDFADFIAINKVERRQGLDALRDVRTTVRRSRFGGKAVNDDEYPVYGTIASRFNDDGVSGLYADIVKSLSPTNSYFSVTKINPQRKYSKVSTQRQAIIPTQRENYLAEISTTVRNYHQTKQDVLQHVKNLEALEVVSKLVENTPQLLEKKNAEKNKIPEWVIAKLDKWQEQVKQYNEDGFSYEVRGKTVKVDSNFKTLSGEILPRVATPYFESAYELVRFFYEENVPGSFPYVGGIFPFRRRGEDPKRQFAGEGGPKRTNQRFHYLCKGEPAKRLSTAFDSVTLYGADPHERPDIYGKVGESGVSIAHLDDMKLLYKGFPLCDPLTSVSMTINGPAPIILAMFLNTAIDQEIDDFVEKNKRIPNPKEHEEIYDKTLQTVRGTVQADILKEDQAQNTCIFSTEFALKMMGDIQEYFIQNKIRNYYAVSISGYHIAEAGANPITQLAFTLANGFTYVEYYLGRGLKIDDFAPNLSFFFSNGIDAEYGVLGRVARRIWAIAMRDFYGASERSQKLKYHIQTSGRSLHAQEMTFNDIRTTLQALMALYDNCNSLHTNAFDEAVTTPTEASVRQAMAIQLIINQEFGLNKCENVNQGSFFIKLLTDRVEESVLKEFERLSARGGVLGAMETQYQRAQIQEESLHYERQKDSGELPLVGVNTFLNPKVDVNTERGEANLIRASYEEKTDQINRLKEFISDPIRVKENGRQNALIKLKEVAWAGGNVFAELMSTVRFCSLGEISQALFEVGGRYRRNM